MILRLIIYLNTFLFLVLTPGCSPKTAAVPGDNSASLPVAYNSTRIWKDTDASTGNLSCPTQPLPLEYRLLNIDTAESRKLLIFQGAASGEVSGDTVLIEIPMPDGSWELFEVNQVQVMAPALAAKYPELKTYSGKSKIYPADQIRLEANPTGIRCMILSDRGTVLLDPFCKTFPLHMISYYKKNLPHGSKDDFESK